MPNYALLATGQLPVTAVAQQLPQVVPASPTNLGGVRGEGVQVILTCLKASTVSLFYGSSNAVTTANGKEIAPGNQDVIVVNDLSEIWVIAASANATATWSVTNR